MFFEKKYIKKEISNIQRSVFSSLFKIILSEIIGSMGNFFIQLRNLSIKI